jgi:mono/diheme cytochrome c family protein
MLALIFLVGLGLWSQFWPAPLEAQADASQPYEARPEWYFMFLFQLLKHFKGPYEIVGTFVLPTLFFLLLFFWPFLDRNPDRNPRRRPIAMALLGGSTAGLVGLTIFALATNVRMKEPAIAQAQVPATAQPAGPIQRADVAKVYHENCVACHGIDGTGSQIRAGMPAIPDFTSLAWQLSQTDLEITYRIQEGSEPLMPAYRDKLNQQQILSLAIYVRAFSIGVTEPAGSKPGHPASPKPIAPATAPVTAHMAPAQIYRAYCLACHDADGRGNSIRKGAMPEIPDFVDAKWQTSRSNQDLLHSILEGKGTFMLPMKNKLSQTDAEQMVAYVRGFQGGKQVLEVEKPKQVVPPSSQQPVVVPAPKATAGQRASPSSPDTAARIRAATGLYRQNCLTCHGIDGRGLEIKASMPSIPDFTNRSWQEGITNPQISVSILDGKGTLMPALRGRVSEDQALDLVAYVRAFGPARPATTEPGASDFEKRFRELEDQWNELERQIQSLESPKP